MGKMAGDRFRSGVKRRLQILRISCPIRPLDSCATMVLQNSCLSAKVRNRLKRGFRLFVEQTADDRASHNFHCSWMGFLELGLCLSALKSRRLASWLFPHLPFGR
uniref:Uncharacterized protein n=1 Tax=Heterorhabditis bacteriophora TaxID=37862 RepID=A0A1I7WNN4_HETBA